MKGQGIVEYVLILVLCVVVVVIVIALVGPSVGNIMSNITNRINDNSTCTNNTFECRQTQFQKCMKTELYTRQECIDMVGGK